MYNYSVSPNNFHEWRLGENTSFNIPENVLTLGNTYTLKIIANDKDDSGNLINRSSTYIPLNFSELNNKATDILTNNTTLINSNSLYNSGLIQGSGDYLQKAGQTTNKGTMTQGSINVQGGSFVADGVTNVADVLTNSGLLTGSGIINGNVKNYGIINPGSSPGKLTINGDYTQDSLGKLAIELGGHEQGNNYDWLYINGNAYLDGLLDISFYEGFIPMAGDTFSFLTTTGLIAGSFKTFTIENSSNNYWNITYESKTVTLNYLGANNPNPVPEPSVMLLMGIGGLGGLVEAARRRKKAC